jgi:hypothetical protein
MLALQILHSVTITDYPGFGFLRQKSRTLRQPLLDPAGYGGNIGAYLNTEQKMIEAQNRLQSAYENALKAEEYASRYPSHTIDI